MAAPLAERMRPRLLSDYIGQEHLVGQDAVLSNSLSQGKLPSIILWGPPGVGKTTLALLISNELKRPFFALSAINSGVKDIRDTIAKAEQQRFFDQPSPILFIDEIHRFSKSQQDSLLGAIEKGTVTLIGATTENPSFEVISALLSRCQVYVLKPLDIEHLKAIVHRALTKDGDLKLRDIQIIEYEALLKYSSGDARKLLNVLELVINQLPLDEPISINNNLIEQIIQKEFLHYDKAGDQHYDTISAFIKSVRGGHPDAAIYYLARMIAGGEDPIFICRRLIILATEDIGLANPNALLIANACFDAVQKIGLPEGRIPMAQATIYLATSTKSNSAYLAINKAMAIVGETGNLPIPLHLKNAPTQLMKELGYSDGYMYPHDIPPDQIRYNYLPEGLPIKEFYLPKDIGAERKLAEIKSSICLKGE